MITDKERANPFEEAIHTAGESLQVKMWTALPGQIVQFDPVRQVASVQPTIQAEMNSPAGKVSLVTMPLCLDCPVHFPRGGGGVLTFPVAAGDECLIVFSSRCIDGWWQSGGVQPQAELRMHDLSDGFAIVGFSSLPHVISALSTTAVELRSLDRATVISLNPTAQTVDITAPGGVTVEANVAITGDVTITGAAHITGAVTSDANMTVGADLTVIGNLLASGTVDLGGTGGHFVQTTAGPATKVRAV